MENIKKFDEAEHDFTDTITAGLPSREDDYSDGYQ